MIEYSFYINVILFLLGVALIFVVLTQQKEHPIIVRALLLIYLFVVLQYNVENFRFTAQWLMIGSAGVAWLVWILQPIPASE